MDVKFYLRKQEIHICIATKKLPVHFLPRTRVIVPGHGSNQRGGLVMLATHTWRSSQLNYPNPLGGFVLFLWHKLRRRPACFIQSLARFYRVRTYLRSNYGT